MWSARCGAFCPLDSFSSDGITPRACDAARPRSKARSQASRRRAPLPGLGLAVTIGWRGSAMLTLAVAACAAALLVASAGGVGVVWSRPKWLPLISAGSNRLVGQTCQSRACTKTTGFGKTRHLHSYLNHFMRGQHCPLRDNPVALRIACLLLKVIDLRREIARAMTNAISSFALDSGGATQPTQDVHAP